MEIPNSNKVGVKRYTHLGLQHLKLIQNMLEKPEFHEKMQNRFYISLRIYV